MKNVWGTRDVVIVNEGQTLRPRSAWTWFDIVDANGEGRVASHRITFRVREASIER